MVKKYDFAFIFNKQDKTYCPGETIHCTANVTIYEKFDVRCLQLRFMGVAHVDFPVGEHKTHETKLYFRDYQTVFGSKEEGPSIPLNPGTYSYEGHFTLPLNLPSSFKHLYGNVDYTIKAEYDMVQADKSETKHLCVDNFYVKALINLDDIPFPMKPVDKTIKRSFGYGLGRLTFYKSGPLCISHRLPKLVWESGETIPITIEVINKSDVAVKSLRIEVIEKFTFSVVRVIHKKIIDMDVLCRQTFNPEFCNDEALVPPSQKNTFETSFYIDPSKNYPVFNACALLRCEYFIKTVAVTQGLHFNAENKTRVYIGPLGPISKVGDLVSV